MMEEQSEGTQALLHAVDMMAAGDWLQAKLELEESASPVAGRLHMLAADLERQQQERKRAEAFARHEIANALSVARANLEGMIDGVLEPTTARLEAVCDALKTIGIAIHRCKDEPS